MPNFEVIAVSEARELDVNEKSSSCEGNLDTWESDTFADVENVDLVDVQISNNVNCDVKKSCSLQDGGNGTPAPYPSPLPSQDHSRFIGRRCDVMQQENMVEQQIMVEQPNLVEQQNFVATASGRVPAADKPPSPIPSHAEGQAGQSQACDRIMLCVSGDEVLQTQGAPEILISSNIGTCSIINTSSDEDLEASVGSAAAATAAVAASAAPVPGHSPPSPSPPTLPPPTSSSSTDASNMSDGDASTEICDAVLSKEFLSNNDAHTVLSELISLDGVVLEEPNNTPGPPTPRCCAPSIAAAAIPHKSGLPNHPKMECTLEVCTGIYDADKIHRVSTDDIIYVDTYYDGCITARCPGSDFWKQGERVIRPRKKPPEFNVASGDADIDMESSKRHYEDTSYAKGIDVDE